MFPSLLGAAAVWLLLHDGRTRRLPVRRRRTVPVRRFLGVLVAAAAAVAATAAFGVVGLLATAAGCTALWLRTRRAVPARLPVTGELPVVVGLLSAGIRAGATVPSCLSSISRAARGDLGRELDLIAQRLRLGADPATAWSDTALPEPLTAIGRDLARAADTGAPVADLLDRHAADLSRALRARATARIERLGVLVVAPLGVCFLPSFVLIGVVPMVAQLLTRVLGD